MTTMMITMNTIGLIWGESPPLLLRNGSAAARAESRVANSMDNEALNTNANSMTPNRMMMKKGKTRANSARDWPRDRSRRRSINAMSPSGE